MIPQSSSKTEYVIDNIGGWIYEVKTTVEVNQFNIDMLKSKRDQKQTNVLDDQSELDALNLQITTFEAQLVNPTP